MRKRAQSRNESSRRRPPSRRSAPTTIRARPPPLPSTISRTLTARPLARLTETLLRSRGQVRADERDGPVELCLLGLLGRVLESPADQLGAERLVGAQALK